VAEQADAEVRIAHLRAGRPLEPRTGDGGQERSLVVGGVGVLAPRADRGTPHPSGQPRQTGGMRSQVAQRGRSLAHGEGHARGQVVGDRVVEADRPRAGHVGQERGGEDLRDRADLEDRVLARPAACDDARAALPQRAGGDATVLGALALEGGLQMGAELRHVRARVAEPARQRLGAGARRRPWPEGRQRLLRLDRVLQRRGDRHPNTLYVAAAGNGNKNVDTTPLYPCAYADANVLCVGASDHDDGRAIFDPANPSTSAPIAGRPSAR
jgi:hypothetical protein